MDYSGYSINVVREHNLKIISRLLFKQPLSCKELAQITDLSETAIKKNISQLLECNMVKVYEDINEKKSVGRQHIRYQINPNYGAFCGIDLSYGVDKFYIFDACGKELYSEHVDLDVKIVKKDYDSISEKIKYACKTLNVNLCEMAISIPGQIDSKTGIVNFSSRIGGDENINILESFKRNFPDIYILIQNDIRFAINGDALLINRSEDTMALYVQIGYGIVCAIVHNGKILSGYKDIAGEIGTKIDEVGTSVHEKCTVSAMMRKAKEFIEFNTYDEFLSLFKTDIRVQELVKGSARALAHEIDTISNSVGCNNIIILGAVTNYGDMYLDVVNNTLNGFTQNFERNVSFLKDNELIKKGMVKLLQERICYLLIN